MTLPEEFSKESQNIRREVRERTLGYVLTALGLVAGLAWNEAITAFITEVFPISKDGLTAKIMYALIMTFVVVAAGRYVVRSAMKQDGGGPT